MGKLVRDKIDDKIRNNGEVPITRILDSTEYKVELIRKISEEYHELEEAISLGDKEKICEESADLFETIKAYNELVNNSFSDIISLMDEKREKRGGFSKRLFLERVEK